MAAPFLKHAIFPFWHWLNYERLFLAGTWLVCLSVFAGRYHRSATEFNTPLPATAPFSNPFKPPEPSFSPAELAERRERWHWVSQIPEPKNPDATVQSRLVEEWKAKRQEAESLSLPGNFPEQGNYGHMEVDFGAQWLMGRMIVRGYGKELYNRTRQRQVVNDSFLIENEPLEHQVYRFPNDERPTRLLGQNLKSDAEMLMDWTVGSKHDSPRWPELGEQVALAFAGGTMPLAYGAELQYAAGSVKPNLADDLSKPSCGGPLYPPVHAVFYASLGMIEDPRIAYYVFQLISAFAIFVAAFSVRIMTEGRIWTPVACLFLILYPGYQPGLTLGQNHVVSLAVIMVGWALNCRGYPVLGGIVWGLLAFKPVWAVAFGLVPLLMWRPKFLIGMAASGLSLCAATLPIVGIHGWQHWLKNGSMATEVYNRNSNWIDLSRDLSGIVRRMMLDFKLGELERNVPVYKLFGNEPKYSEADLVSWAVLFAMFAATVAVYWIWGKPRKSLGLSAGFLFLGCYLCCFRFMYYDALLSALGVAALLAYPKWFLRKNEWNLAGDADPTARRGGMHLNSFPLLICGLLLLLHTYFLQLRPNMLVLGDYDESAANSVKVRWTVGLIYDYATDTFLVIALWLWAGWKMIRGGERPEGH